MKEFKRQVNRIARAVLFYNILLLAVILGDTLIQSVRLILEHPDEAQLSKALHQLELSIGLYGGPSIIGIATISYTHLVSPIVESNDTLPYNYTSRYPWTFSSHAI